MDNLKTALFLGFASRRTDHWRRSSSSGGSALISACDDPAVVDGRGAGPRLARRDGQHDGPGGFVIALGAIVDDAIIDVENILRRLRQCRQEGSSGVSTARVILEASLEVRGAIIYATLIDRRGRDAGVLPRGLVRRLLPTSGPRRTPSRFWLRWSSP